MKAQRKQRKMIKNDKKKQMRQMTKTIGKGKKEKEKVGRARRRISSPKASNGQRFPCPALLSPWFSWG